MSESVPISVFIYGLFYNGNGKSICTGDTTNIFRCRATQTDMSNQESYENAISILYTSYIGGYTPEAL